MAAWDADERFDLCDAEGRPLGRDKPRALVHRDGDWHRSLHLWVVLRDPRLGARVLLQRRSQAKDTWPGALDVAVAGHLRASERLEDALRESNEEIGLEVGPADVIRLGTRFRESAPRPGLVDREIQDILATVASVPFESLAPAADEVESLVALTLDDAASLLGGKLSSVTAPRLDAATRVVDLAEVRAGELVAATDDYWRVVSASVLEVARGLVPAPFQLGRG